MLTARLRLRILDLLLDFYTSPQNINNATMKLSRIAHAVSTSPDLVAAALEALKEQRPPLIEELIDDTIGERIFRISSPGVRLIANLHSSDR